MPQVRRATATQLPRRACQLASFPAHMDSGPPSRFEPWSWYLRRRARNLLLKLRAAVGPPALPSLAFPAPVEVPTLRLSAGEWVRVRPFLDIQSTLDARGGLRGCRFAPGMRAYCGRRLRVAKVVARFFDEAHGRMLRGRHLVLLEGAYCDGSISPSTQGCDRMCFYFWRAEWLERA